MAETKALLDRFNELAANYSDETADEFARLQARDRRRRTRGTSTRQLEHAMDALRLPPVRRRRRPSSPAASAAASRCAACCSRQPDLLLLDEPTNHLDAESVAWLETHLAEYPGTVVAVTHDRYFLDNVAGWILELDRGRGIPYEGNYSALARAEAEAPGAGGEVRGRAPEDDRRRARVDPPEPQGPPDQAEGPHQQLRGAARPGAQRQARRGPDPHPGRPAPGRRRGRGRGPAQGLRRPPADRGPQLRPAAAAASSA